MSVKLYSLPAACVSIMNDRLADEYAAERFYVAASIWCDVEGFKCASDYFVDEYHDERRHEHRIQKEMSNYGILATLPQVQAAQPSFNDLKDIVKQAYEMEYKLCEAYQKAVLDVQNEYPACADFFMYFVKVQKKAVVDYAEIMKKLDGIDGKFELIEISKKVFK
jgi:ferritin